jgi:tRNA-2-methylthio-N6-dimethylallyladenosine synthase
MNSAESAALELVLAERGWKKSPAAESADLVLLNTCSVRETAEQRIRGRLAHYEAQKKTRPFFLVVAGCMASRLGKKLKDDFSAVNAVMGTEERGIFPRILEAAEQKTFLDAEYNGEKPYLFSGSHLENGAFRSFVPIMHGCNNFCSYCIVPYVRGREVSRSPESIRAELALLSKKGVREITLLGQNVNSYQYEDTDFPLLLLQIAGAIAGTSIEWVRFLSSNPKDLSAKTIAVMAEHSCFCRHLHLPLQHGADRLLAAMNRRYTAASYLALLEKLRAAMPDISISSDLLVGFPGETEKDFEELLSIMETIRFSYAYMYYYNPREGTAAYSFTNTVDEAEKHRRLSQVIALQKKITIQSLQRRVGQTQRVLVERVSRKSADELLGRTEHDEMAVFPGPRGLIGGFKNISLRALDGVTFRGVS